MASSMAMSIMSGSAPRARSVSAHAAGPQGLAAARLLTRWVTPPPSPTWAASSGRSSLPRAGGLAIASSPMRGLPPLAAAARGVAAAASASSPGDERLAAIRAAMAAAGVDAFIVPSEDPHQSEYPPTCWDRRVFISRFTGSAGTAVITADKAALWTDGRYFLQANKQLGEEWVLMKAGLPGTPDIAEWLVDVLPKVWIPTSSPCGTGGLVGIDPYLHSAKAADEMSEKLEDGGCTLGAMDGPNLVDGVWGADQPPMPSAPVRVHPVEHAGQSVPEKLDAMRAAAKEEGATALLVTMLDEVAWLYNIRGSDVEFNPVVVSYAYVDSEGARLYVDPAKVSGETAEHLASSGVAVRPYEDLLGEIEAAANAGEKILMDESRAPLAVVLAAEAAGGQGEGGVVRGASPVQMAKACKNEAELAGMREAHLRDGAAEARFLSWLDAEVAAGREVSEAEADIVLCNFRAEMPGYIEPSFPTIAGEGPNGAIIHYRAKAGEDRMIGASSMLLLDSGGQYECGTTDVTRTVHLGEPSDFQREAYTRVLQGHIALTTLVFPEDTPGFVLDGHARRPLWAAGLDYRHGTGHGVGAALNVHEGPQSISPRFANQAPMKPGMVVSNEPGYYEDGEFGIRIENLLICREAPTEHQYGGTKFLSFLPLTYIPIQKKLIKAELLSRDEVAWLDTYHAEVWEVISPRMDEGEAAYAWLKEACAPIKVPALSLS